MCIRDRCVCVCVCVCVFVHVCVCMHGSVVCVCVCARAHVLVRMHAKPSVFLPLSYKWSVPQKALVLFSHYLKHWSAFFSAFIKLHKTVMQFNLYLIKFIYKIFICNFCQQHISLHSMPPLLHLLHWWCMHLVSLGHQVPQERVKMSQVGWD